MLYGIFSDVHANLEALEAMLDFFRYREVDRYVCAGDLVGYGPNPNECVDLVRRLSPLWIVVGNHDWAACGLKDITWFNEYAQKAIIWTRQVLNEQNQIYLSELPKIIRHSDFTLVHGSPRDPLDEYLLTREQYRENLPYLNTAMTFVGHTHIPFVFSLNAIQVFQESSPVELPAHDNYLVNPGSVGQPRDGNNKAACALYDTRNRTLELFRLEYDIAKTQDKMRRARLPAFLIERLYWGK